MLLRSVLFAAVVALFTVGAVAQASTITQKARELELAMSTLQQQAATSLDQATKDQVTQLRQTNDRMVDLARQIAAMQCAANDTVCARKRGALNVQYAKLSQTQQLATSPLQARPNQSKTFAEAVIKYLEKVRDAQVAIVSAG